MEVVGNQWMSALRSFGPDLYGGTSGIALYLAKLHELTSEKLFKTTFDGAIEQAVSQLDKYPQKARLGFWAGVLGIAWALLECGRESQALGLVEQTIKLDPDDCMLDVLSGVAGVIPCLLILHKRYRRQDCLDAAVRYGERLLADAKHSDNYCSWKTLPGSEAEGQQNLTGFSHGAAGIAVALFELSQVTGEKRFANAASQGFEYEQRWFNPQYGNWPDFREALPSQQPSYSVSWCHGAPGIALARLRAWQLTRNGVYRQQAEIALKTTGQSLQMSAPGQESLCLCHGSAGNADALLYGSDVLSDMTYRQAAEQIGLRGIEIYAKNGLPWPPGVMGGIENPSLKCLELPGRVISIFGSPSPTKCRRWLQRAIGQRFATIGADLAAKDVARLARVPGSVHTVSSVPVKYWLQLDERRCGFTYTLPQLAAYFPVEAVVDRPRAVRDALTESANPNKRRGWEAMHRRRLADFQILYAIRGGFEEGCRNNGALIYAWLLKCNRTRRVEVETVVLAFGAKCRPPLSPADCRHAVQSAYARKGDGKACFARMLDQTISDWLHVTPEESELVKFPPCKPIRRREADGEAGLGDQWQTSTTRGNTRNRRTPEPDTARSGNEAVAREGRPSHFARNGTARLQKPRVRIPPCAQGSRRELSYPKRPAFRAIC